MQFLTFFVRGVDQLVAELSMGWVDPWVGLGWVGSQKMEPVDNCGRSPPLDSRCGSILLVFRLYYSSYLPRVDNSIDRLCARFVSYLHRRRLAVSFDELAGSSQAAHQRISAA